MQPAQASQKVQIEKLRWYIGKLIGEAAQAEKSRDHELAIKDYLEAGDILLLLSKRESRYTEWKYYADTAETCQKRAKALIAMGPVQISKPAASVGAPTPSPVKPQAPAIATPRPVEAPSLKMLTVEAPELPMLPAPVDC
jgi:hypothetical protein